MTETIGHTWRCPENVANRSDSLDVPPTAIFMQMAEQMTSTSDGAAVLVIERKQ